MWQDELREWIEWRLEQGGIQPLVLKALGGWKDSKSVERYAKPEATRAAIVRHLPKKR